MNEDNVKPDITMCSDNSVPTANNENINNQNNKEDNKDFDFDKLLLDDVNKNKKNELNEECEEEEKYHSCSEEENQDSENDNKEWNEAKEEDELKKENVIDEEALKLAESKLSEEEKEERIQNSNKLKAEGNESFKEGKWQDSVELYSQGLLISLYSQNDLRSVLYSNRAASLIKLDKKQQALEDLNNSLTLKSDYIRARLRRADLCEQMDKLEEALEDYKTLLQADPSLYVARAACERLPIKINEKNEKMKQEVFGKLKELGNVVLKPFGLSTENFKVQQDPNTGSYSINMQK